MLTVFKRKPNNIVKILQQRAKKNPLGLAYLSIADDETEKARITYGDLDEKARIIAAYLQNKQGLGQRVILLYPPGIEFITAFMGCLYAGVIAIPMSCAAPTEFKKIRDTLLAITKDAEAIGIFTLPDFIASIKESLPDLLHSNKIFIENSTAVSAVAAEYKNDEINDNTIAYLQYTSGSTSLSKGVVVKQKHLSHSLYYTVKQWHYTKHSNTLIWAPHSHVYGLVCGLLVPLYHGTPSIIMSPTAFIKQPVCWLKAITKYRVSHSGCPNFGYDYCIREFDENMLTGVDLSCWKVAVNGGEIVRNETLLGFSKIFAKYGFAIQQFCSAYGMSELTGLIASTRPNKNPSTISVNNADLNNNQIIINGVDEDKNNARVFVSSGSFLYGLKAVIVNPNTLLLANPTEVGEVWLSGPSLAEGYWNRIEETDKIFKAQLANQKEYYFRTGDLGFIQDNQLYLSGRLKELIIVYGKNYYSLDLETVAKKSHSELKNQNNAAFSLEVLDNEEVFLVQEISTITILPNKAQEIVNSIRKVILQQQGIDVYGIILVENGAIPKTVSGKIQRNLCKQWLTEKKLAVIYASIKNSAVNDSEKISPPLEQSTENSLSTIDIEPVLAHLQNELINLVATTLQIDNKKINLNDPVSIYGFDSISLTKLTALLANTYSLNITPAMLFEYETLQDFSLALLQQNIDIFSNYYNNLDLDNKLSSNKIKSFSSKSIDHNLTEQKSPILQEDVAIIGMSGIFPGSSDPQTLWKNLIAEQDLISEIPLERWDWRDYYGDQGNYQTKVKWGGFIEGMDQFDADFFNISPKEAELMDPQQRLFLQIVWKLIEHAGYTPQMLSTCKTGVFVGVSTNDYSELLQQVGECSAQVSTGTFHSVLPNRISYLFNFNGPSEAIDTACSSSLVSIHHAVKAIQNDDCEMAIAGGVNAILTPTLYLAATKAGMLSEDGRCKTFDKSANGFVRAEGVGAILLKPLKKALADGDRIYGVIKGSAINHGGHVSSLTVPNPNAQAEVINTAMARAKVDAEAISYIEMHGTGTALGDPIEINGLKKVFQRSLEKQSNEADKPYCGLGSIKANIGHLEAAAGIAGVIKVLLMLQYKKIPKQLHVKEVNPYISLENTPFYIVAETQEWTSVGPRRAGISSFGFGGANAHVIIEEGPEYNLLTEQHKPYYLATFSAKHPTSLKHYLENFALYLEQNPALPIEAIAYTLNARRAHFNHRLAIVASSTEELQIALKKFQSDREVKNCFIGQATQQLEEHVALYTKVLKTTLEDIQNHEQIDTKNYKSNLETLASLYVKGYELDWNLLHHNANQQATVLPSYVFLQERYWIPEVSNQKTIGIKNYAHQKETSNLAGLYYYQPQWIFKEIEPINFSATTLILDNGSLAEEFKNKNNFIQAIFAEKYQVTEHGYEINKNKIEDYRTLFNTLKEKQKFPQIIIYKNSSSVEDTCKELIYFSQALIEQNKKVEVLVISEGKEKSLLTGAISGFARVLELECPNIIVRVIELEKLLPDILTKELGQQEKEVRYHRAQRTIRNYCEVDVAASYNLPLKTNGVYLITGGAGDLGLIFAHYLAKHYQAKLILTGRSELKPKQINAINALQALGSEVIYLQKDITKRQQVEELIQSVKIKFGRINGIIHSAGLIQDALIPNKTLKQIESVLAPKILGTTYLDELTGNDSLDFFVLFSSVASVFGNMGQSAYAYANGFMDGFAYYRELLVQQGLRKGKTVSINWPLWAEGGMQVDSNFLQLMEQNLGLKPLAQTDGLAAFLTVLSITSPQIIVLYGNKNKLEESLNRTLSIKKLNEETRLNVNTDHHSLQDQIALSLREMVIDLLKIKSEKLNSKINLSEYGMDSIIFAEFAVKINSYYQLDLTPALFFAHGTIEALSAYLAVEFPQNVAKYNKVQNKPSDVANAKVNESKSASVQFTAEPEEKSYLPIAIIGMHGLFPQSDNLETFWQHLEGQHDLIMEVPKTRWDWREYYSESTDDSAKTNSKWGGFIENVDQFDASFFNISPREAELMDPQHRLFLETVWKTFEDAGYDPDKLPTSDVGLFAGVQFNEYQELMTMANIKPDGYAATGNAHAMLVNRVSYILNLHGPSEAIDTACSSALVALHRAISALQNQECMLAVAGGVSLALSPHTYVATTRMGILSPDGRCKTFDKAANGYVKGEGVGALLLKPLAQAQKDGDCIHGIIIGSAVNHGGKAQSLTAPNPIAQAELIKKAYTLAKIAPSTISYIETHGTGTVLGDPIEIDGLKRAFGTTTTHYTCGIGSVKTNIGHLEPAAGIASAIKVILSMRHQKLPGIVNFNELNPYLNLKESPFYIVEKTKEWRPLVDDQGKVIPRRAGVSSFGFGGTNAHIIIEEAPQHILLNQQHKPSYLISISAKQLISLKQKIKDLHLYLKNNSTLPLEAVVYTLNVGRSHLNYRLAWVVSSIEELQEKLHYFLNQVNIEVVCKKITHNESGKENIDSQMLTNTLEELKTVDFSNPEKYRRILETLAELYIKGFDLDWELLHKGETQQKIHLPTYPFLKKHYWINSSAVKQDINNNLDNLAETKNNIAEKTVNNPNADSLALLLEQINSGKLTADEALKYIQIENVDD